MDVLVNELVEKFTIAEMERVCLFAFNMDLESITDADNRRDRFFELVRYAQQKGKLDALLKRCRIENSNFVGEVGPTQYASSGMMSQDFQLMELLKTVRELTVNVKLLTHSMDTQIRPLVMLSVGMSTISLLVSMVAIITVLVQQ